MIDLSDGLSIDLRHVCEESNVGAVIHANAVPVASLNRHEVELRHALHGGDEYQLLFTAPQGHRVPNAIAGVPITLIGYIDEFPDIMIEYESDNGKLEVELKPEGWQHFAPAKSSSRPVAVSFATSVTKKRVVASAKAKRPVAGAAKTARKKVVPKKSRSHKG
jgi:hypothetical protein